MGVAADEKGAVIALGFAVFDDRLRRCGNVGFVEGSVKARAPVAGGSEDDRLEGIGGVWFDVVIGGDQGIDVDEVLIAGRSTCAFVHGPIEPRSSLWG